MRSFFVSLAFLIPLLGIGQSTMRLSPEAEISVLTMDPGQFELYAAFGHSAFRVKDRFYHIDKVYNYGTFDFNQPNFYWNFAKGNLNYMLGTKEFNRFAYEYQYFNRSIREQTLNLSDSQKQAFFQFLQHNTKGDNKYYRYDYFYNNCATKIRDVLKDVLGDSLVFDPKYVTETTTIRKKTDEYLEYQPWGDFGIDLGLGMPMDKEMTPEMFMFLPDYVELGLKHAHIYRGGKKYDAVKDSRILFQAKEQTFEKTTITPFIFFWLLFFLSLFITILDLKKRRVRHKWFDALLFTTLGLVGLLLTFLWFFTDHMASKNNLNILWAMPTHLMLPFLFFKRNKPKWLNIYFYLTLTLATVLFLFWWMFPQQIHYALSPVFLTIMVRSWVNRKNFEVF